MKYISILDMNIVMDMRINIWHKEQMKKGKQTKITDKCWELFSTNNNAFFCVNNAGLK